MRPNLVILSYPTVGPSGAYVPSATYSFFSRDYKPPAHHRSIGKDIVHNQNGVFKYLYDNGPSYRSWEPFRLIIDDRFAPIVGSATVQYQNLMDMWERTGPFEMEGPDGELYDVHWAVDKLEKDFISFPASVGDKIEYTITVQFEEA